MTSNDKDKDDKKAKGDAAARAAERAARQAANKAEREARRAARQAERAAHRAQSEQAPEKPGDRTQDKPRGKATGKAAAKASGKLPAQPVAGAAPKAATSLPSSVAPLLVSPESAAEPVAKSGTPPFNILVIGQGRRLGSEAALFAASLRRNAPDWRGRLIVAEPKPEGPWAGTDTQIPTLQRAAIAAFGAEILPFTAQHFGAGYPYGNKIEALSLLPAGEPFMFFDSDTLITGPLDRMEIDFSRPSASMRRTGTWPEPPLYGPGYGDIWKSLYDRFGLDYESSLDKSQPDEYWERYLYFNAGWFFGNDPQEFGRRFLDWSLAIRNEPRDALACQSLDPWLDQITLPLVIHSLGGGRPGPELAGLDGWASCHYRNLSLLYARESDEVVALIEDLAADYRISTFLAEDEAAKQLIIEGKGRSSVRPLFGDNGSEWPEKKIRQTLRRADLWFR